VVVAVAQVLPEKTEYQVEMVVLELRLRIAAQR
jgi:hypothetical protein